jgi:RNA polymerase sigma-70 factor (ECF subfamily)
MDQDVAEQRFTNAYHDYADALFRHCYFRIGDRERGKELMQEAFTKAWEYAAKGNVIEDIKSFLYRTANNLIVDQLRRKKLRTETSFEDMQEAGFDIASDEDATRLVKKKFTEQQMVTVINQIDEPYRTAVVMRYIDDMQPAEIAEALDESTTAVSSRISRGLKKLEAQLKNYG